MRIYYFAGGHVCSNSHEVFNDNQYDEEIVSVDPSVYNTTKNAHFSIINSRIRISVSCESTLRSLQKVGPYFQLLHKFYIDFSNNGAITYSSFVRMIICISCESGDFLLLPTHLL